jgi:PAS domain S-box-containing protein
MTAARKPRRVAAPAQTTAVQLQRAHVVAGIAARFLSAMPFDDALQMALADMGRLAAVARVNVFRFSADHRLVRNTHAWTTAGVASLQAVLQAVPVAPFAWLHQQLCEHECVWVPDVQALPREAAAEKRIWQQYNIGAIAMVALKDASSVRGYVCFDHMPDARVWTDAEAEFLRTCADIIAGAQLRHEAELALHAQQANLAALVAERTAQLQAANTALQDEIAERARAEQACAEHGHLLTIMTAQLTDMVYYKDAQLRYLFSSEAYCRRILRCSQADCVGKTDRELAAMARARGQQQPFAERDYTSDVATRNAARPCSFVEEAVVDGEQLTLEVSKTPLLDAHGQFSGLVGSARDITQRKRVERAIRESEARYRTIFEQSPIALLELNAAALKHRLRELGDAGITHLHDFFAQNPERLQEYAARLVIVDVNHAGVALMEAESREQLIRQFNAMFLRSTWPAFLSLCIAIAHDELLCECDMPLQTLTGHTRVCFTRWVVAKGYAESYGKMFAAFIDTTAQTRARAALALSENRHRLMFENNPMALFETDHREVVAYLAHLRGLGVDDFGAFFAEHPEEVREGMRRIRFVDTNIATLRLLRAESKIQVLTRFADVFTEHAWRAFTQLLVSIAQGEHTFECESVFRCYDGTLLDVAIRVAAVPGNETDCGWVISSVTDITALKRLQARLAAQTAPVS